VGRGGEATIRGRKAFHSVTALVHIEHVSAREGSCTEVIPQVSGKGVRVPRHTSTESREPGAGSRKPEAGTAPHPPLHKRKEERRGPLVNLCKKVLEAAKGRGRDGCQSGGGSPGSSRRRRRCAVLAS
jgi:hypothetical protein